MNKIMRHINQNIRLTRIKHTNTIKAGIATQVGKTACDIFNMLKVASINPLNPDLYKAYRSPTLSYLHKFCKISLPK